MNGFGGGGFGGGGGAVNLSGLLELKGSTDASANPNYPAASKGDVYIITVAGKVGGGSGKSVEVSDTVVAIADNAGGSEASVGTSWIVLEHNLVGALLAANNLSDLANPVTACTNLGVGERLLYTGSLAGDTAKNFPNVFTAAYRVYIIEVIALTISSDSDVTLQPSVAGTVVGSGYYTMGDRTDISGNRVAQNVSGGSGWKVCRAGTNGSYICAKLISPYHAVAKQMETKSSGSDGANVYGYVLEGLLTDASLCDGFKLTAASPMTAIVKVTGRP